MVLVKMVVVLIESLSNGYQLDYCLKHRYNVDYQVDFYEFQGEFQAVLKENKAFVLIESLRNGHYKVDYCLCKVELKKNEAVVLNPNEVGSGNYLFLIDCFLKTGQFSWEKLVMSFKKVYSNTTTQHLAYFYQL